MAAAGVVDGGNSSSCDFEANWRVATGSLKRTVVFESSSEDSLGAASSPDSVYDSATPLVLKPELADSGPCEIKIHFLQKHEIRQIYVRSTARVYEVYYAKSCQSENEYLCTVRCSIAERDEQVLQAFDIKDFSESTENSSEELKEEKLAGEGNNGTSEDDWVEVKVPDSSHENNINFLSKKKNASIGREIQDFYEATAEISDSDPCVSITLRFLSLQNKSCLCVDEVYVFTDPVSAINSDHQSLDVKGSAGSSLMAMLVPTLLQLSKSGMSQIQGHQASSDLQNCSKIETQSKTTDLTDLTSHQNEKGGDDQQHLKVQRVDGSTTEPAETHFCNQILNGDKSDNQQHLKVQKVEGSTTEPAESHLCYQILNGDKSDNLLVKDDSAYGRIEKVLEQLVSRVGRIEEVCLRFEENMLKPLNSMEMRIQQVEQQLEELVNNSQHPGFPPCMRISAPSFSSCNSNSSSFHNDGCDYQPCRAPESEKKEMTSGDLFNASHGIPSSAIVPHLPSLVVTAPDFSCEDNLDDDGTKSPKISPQESQRKPLIDDVLAASLSSFLSASTDNLSVCKRNPSISHGTSEITSGKVHAENVQALINGVEITSDMNAKEEPSRYTQVLTIMAPEFNSEEIANEECLNNAEFASVAFPKFTSNIGERGNDATSKATEDACSMVASGLPDISKDELVSSECPDEEILPKHSESSLVDFGIPILDVKFTPYEDYRTQLPLEALLDDAINHNVEADTLQGNGVQDAYAQESNFIDINEEGERGDSLTDTSLVIDPGTCDMTPGSTEGSVIDDSYLTCKQETVASLI